MYRRIDFRRDKHGIPGKVADIEYDPNRSARIALIQYADGEKRYILHPRGLQVGDAVISGPRLGHPPGQRGAAARDSARHRRAQRRAQAGQGRPDGALGRHFGGGGGQGRRPRHHQADELDGGCAWCTATAWRRSARWATPSTSCCVGKAGKSRWLGKRPKVRGVAMNPVDHPLGGGEGKSSGGRPPVSPWGKPEGVKTRNKKKPSQRLIVRGRKRGKATQS